MQDAPASTCAQWQQHCAATHAIRRWRDERERHKTLLKARGSGSSSHAASAPAAAAAAAASNPYQAAAAAAAALLAPRTCEELMRQVQQVWPVETPEPAGLLPSCRLRPYQKQSLAFMLELERAPAGAATVGGESHRESLDRWYPSTLREVRGGWLCDEVGMGKTIVCIVSRPRVLTCFCAVFSSVKSACASLMMMCALVDRHSCWPTRSRAPGAVYGT
jgi:hypothetical protein